MLAVLLPLRLAVSGPRCRLLTERCELEGAGEGGRDIAGAAPASVDVDSILPLLDGAAGGAGGWVGLRLLRLVLVEVGKRVREFGSGWCGCACASCGCEPSASKSGVGYSMLAGVENTRRRGYLQRVG